MAISKESEFRQSFPEIIALLDTAQDHEWILVDEYVTRIGVGLQTSVIFRNLKTARGWGCLWRIDAKRLEGLKGRTYYGERPDSPQSLEFMEEFKRRLGCEGAGFDKVRNELKNGFHHSSKELLRSEIARRCF